MVKQQVQFLGACNHHEVYKQLSQADIFILPSYREAFGIAYVEAMSCGLLTVGVKGQGAEAFIEHGKTGLLVSPKSVDSLSQALAAVLASPDIMQAIAEEGRNHVYKNFTWEDHAQHLTKVYQELIDEL